MATDPNATRAAQAGKTVTTADGYQIVYDDNGFGRKSVAPDGSVKYYDSLGNQTSTVWDGPQPNTQQTPDEQGSLSQQFQTASSMQRAATPLSEPTQVTVSRENVGSGVVVAEGDTSGTAGTEQKTVTDEESLSSGEEIVTPEKQKEIDSTTDAQTEKEQQAKLEQEQADNRARLRTEEEAAGDPEGKKWTAGAVDQVRTQQSVFVARNSIQKDDWRVHLGLAPSAKYLYKTAKVGDILYPLAATDGVIFPYSPAIQTAYRANYDPLDLMHSNYRLYFYKNSQVDEIQLTADFTAQDTTEANYMLAVIHFFKSVTKMFYGQDGNNGPKAGTPPPLCYLNGYGQYQFNEHPCLVSNFSYNLPNDVDYIRAGSPTVTPGTNTNGYESRATKGFSFSDLFSLSKLRAQGSRLKTNSMSAEPVWKNYSNEKATYVPTKMQIQLTLIPVVTRNDISKNFSLEKYATGALLNGRTRSGGGIW